MHGLLFREPISAWTHLAWMLLAIPAAFPLWRRAGTDLAKRAGAVVFAATLVLCYAGSFLYHSVPGPLVSLCHALDHVGIFLLIAGTVTPIGLVVLDGWWRRGLVAGIWGLAAAGITLRLAVHLPLHLMTALYLFMGWAGCATYCELARRLTPLQLRPLWLGGLCYTTGAVFNGLGWPILVPGVFEAHELFHLFVMAGSVCHYWFILASVLPYRSNQPQTAVRFQAAPGPRLVAVEKAIAAPVGGE